jgi:hypothetical protein
MRKRQDILDDLPFESLPPAWTTFDLANFSATKRLWDYQQTALENALKALWGYYEDGCDYRPGEPPSVNDERKQSLARRYVDNRLDVAHDISLGKKRDLRRLLAEHYPVVDGHVPYAHFLNSIGFWMATGSGKTLVLVKLIELLWRLIRLGEIPPHDILVLTCREDLLAQLRAHVDDFNAARGDLHVRLHDLRDYPEVKRAGASLFRHQEAHVFFYRSDNVSDVQKERIVDFRNYDQGGRWYILLDEAHKGDREDSKRKQHLQRPRPQRLPVQLLGHLHRSARHCHLPGRRRRRPSRAVPAAARRAVVRSPPTPPPGAGSRTTGARPARVPG